MILYETINTQGLSSGFPEEELGASDSSEALILMPLASYCPLDERQDPAGWGVDRLPCPFCAFDDDEEGDIDEEDGFDDLDDDFDDDFEDEDFDDEDDYEEDDYDYEDDVEYEYDDDE